MVEKMVEAIKEEALDFMDKDDERISYWYQPCKSWQKAYVQYIEELRDRWPIIAEKVYLVETACQDDTWDLFITGKLEIMMQGIMLGKDSRGVYRELQSANGGDERVLDLGAVYKIGIERHNTAILKIITTLNSCDLTDKIELTNFLDYLHYESIFDYPAIIKIGKKRINEHIKNFNFIKKMQEKKTHE